MRIPTLPHRALIPLAAAAALSCGGDTGTVSTPTGGNPPQIAVSAIRLNDTLSRTRVIGQIDTLHLAAVGPLRFQIDLQQLTSTVGITDLTYVLSDSATGAVVDSASAKSSTEVFGLSPSDVAVRWKRLPHAGAYLIRIKAKTPGAVTPYSGPYQIRFVGSNPVPESAKARLAIGDSIEESIDTPGDVDEFTLVAGPGIRETASFLKVETGSGTDGVIVETIGDGPGIISAFGRGAGDEARPDGTPIGDFFPTAAFPDTVRFRVRGEKPSMTGRYRLKFLKINRAPEGVSATVAAGDTIASSIEFPGDIDEFTFTGTAGKVYAVAMQATTGRSTDKITFTVNGTSRVLAGTTPTLVGQFTSRLDGSAPIKISVQGEPDGTSRGSYRFVVAPIDLRPEQAPTILTLGDTITDAIEILPDRDEYTLNAEVGVTYDFYVQAFDRDTAHRVLVRNTGLTQDGAYILMPGGDLRVNSAFPTLLSAASGHFRAEKAGPVTISVEGIDGYVGKYRLLALKVNPAPETGSAVLTRNVPVLGISDYPGDVDRYTFNTVAGEELNVYLQLLPTKSRAFGGGALLYPGSGLSILVPSTLDSLGGTGSGRFFASFSGPSTVDVVVRDSLGSPLPYRLTLFSPNRAPEFAPSIIRVGDKITNETISPSGDIDEYTLIDTPGAKLKVCVRDPNPRPDQGFGFRVSLSPNYWLTNIFTPSTCTDPVVMPAAGQATVRVDAYNYNKSAPYELEIVRVP